MARNRAEGWKHAKISGHDNEVKVEDLVNAELTSFADRLNMGSNSGTVSVGGICETQVESVLNDKTTSKTDLYIKWDNDTQSNISIKKSKSGQVYLIGTKRFIRGYETLFGEIIPENVKSALYLFFGDDENIPQILSEDNIKNATTEKVHQYQHRKHRLVWDTLKIYNSQLADELLEWFKANIKNITTFCFSTGLAKDEENWAKHVWYKNLLMDEVNMDLLISIDELKDKCDLKTDMIEPGSRGGGTTIQLPFGFVQWHLGQMQFHHKYDKIRSLF